MNVQVQASRLERLCAHPQILCQHGFPLTPLNLEEPWNSALIIGHQRESLVRIDGRDLDAFEFVYARAADRRLFRVIDGPAAGTACV
jgi:hypothetical protein